MPSRGLSDKTLWDNGTEPAPLLSENSALDIAIFLLQIAAARSASCPESAFCSSSDTAARSVCDSKSLLEIDV